jgi:hypothetical protein
MESALSIEELLREFDEPNLKDWKLFGQSAGVTVYRRPDGVSVKYTLMIFFCFL